MEQSGACISRDRPKKEYMDCLKDGMISGGVTEYLCQKREGWKKIYFSDPI